MPESSAGNPQLRAAVVASRVAFMRVELETGNTMLDTVDVSEDHDAAARRVRNAWAAHDEVAHLIAKGHELGLTTDEWDEVSSGLSRLRARLDTRQ
jgi:hypothetical protein